MWLPIVKEYGIPVIDGKAMFISQLDILEYSNILICMSRKKPNIEQMLKSAISAEQLLKQLANAKRLMILCHLIEGAKTVGELNGKIALSQSALSQHLAKMRSEGIIGANKKGQFVYYQIINEEVKQILALLYKLYCQD